MLGEHSTCTNRTAGFTLAELLIVVAIIAVLVAVAIPVFNSQLEKSREATDLANVRSAYAEVATQAITAGQSDDISKTVDLTQQQDGWQTSSSIDIGGITPDDSQRWIGSPRAGGKCRVYYASALNSAVLDWNAGRNLWTTVAVRPGCWRGAWRKLSDKNSNISDTDKALGTYDSESPSGLYQLDSGKKYIITCTYNPYAANSGGKTYGVLASATLLYDANGNRVMDTGATDYKMTETKKTDAYGNEVTYKYTSNGDGTLTYTMTFETPKTGNRYYLGTNFIVRNYADTSNSDRLSFDKTLGMSSVDREALQQQIKNNFILEEAR